MLQNLQGSAGASLSDLNTTLKLANQNMGQLIVAIQGTFPRIVGSFTLDAAATKAIPQTSVLANAIIIAFPSNASAGTLQGSAKALYVSAISPGVSFTVATASGGNATGTEQFSYILVNPQ